MKEINITIKVGEVAPIVLKQFAPCYFIAPENCRCSECGDEHAKYITIVPDPKKYAEPTCEICICEHWLANATKVNVTWEEKW